MWCLLRQNYHWWRNRIHRWEQTAVYGMETSTFTQQEQVQKPIICRGTTTNSAHYSEMLTDWLKPAIRSKCQGQCPSTYCWNFLKTQVQCNASTSVLSRSRLFWLSLVKEVVREWFSAQLKTFFPVGTRKLMQWLTKCVEKQRDYVEKYVNIKFSVCIEINFIATSRIIIDLQNSIFCMTCVDDSYGIHVLNIWWWLGPLYCVVCSCYECLLSWFGSVFIYRCVCYYLLFNSYNVPNIGL
jgi:hypothetical protein